jgi:hypothetical protein
LLHSVFPHQQAENPDLFGGFAAVTAVHVVVGVTVLGFNLAAGLLGGVSWYQHRPSVPFWYLLRIAQAAVVLEALLGMLLVFAGREASSDLHYVYGILPLLVSLLAEGIRAGAAQQELGDLDFDTLPADRQRTVALTIVRREMGVMAMSCIVIFLLALRAAEVSPLI